MHAATARIFGPVASASRTRRVSARPSRASNRRIRGVAPLKAKEAEPGDAVEEISKSMSDARACQTSGLSPGAGLADADAWEAGLPRGCRRTLARARACVASNLTRADRPIVGGAPAPHSSLAHFRCVVEHEVRLLAIDRRG